MIFFINICNRIIHIKIGKKKFVFIMELFPFKDNVSDLEILKSLDKLWDLKYLTNHIISINHNKWIKSFSVSSESVPVLPTFLTNFHKCFIIHISVNMVPIYMPHI